MGFEGKVGKGSELSAKGSEGATKAKKPEIPPQSSRFSVIEPRIMMDANLGWTVDADDLTLALEGVAHSIDSQQDAFSAFLGNFDDLTETAAGAFAAVLGDDATENVHDFVVDLVARLQAAADELGASADDMLTDALGTDADRGEALQSSFGDALFDLSDAGYADREALRTLFGTVELAETFTADVFRSGGISDAIAGLVATYQSTLDDAGITAAEAEAALRDASDAWINSNTTGQRLELSLEDQAASELTFAEDTVNGGADVTIGLDGIAIDFNALFTERLAQIGLPTLLNVGATAGEISFDLTSVAQTETSTGALATVGLQMNNFDFGTLMEVGGAISSTGVELSMGLLSLSATSIDTARFGLFLTGDDLDMSAEADVSAAAPVVTLASTGLSLGVEARIEEVGGAAFVAIAENTSYDLLGIDLDGTLDFATDLNDTDASNDAKSFAASILLASVVDNSAATDMANRLTRFLDDATFTFDVDLSGSVSDAVLRDRMEQAVEGLAVMGAAQVNAFLQDVGAALKAVLQSAMFDITIPFTDIELSQVTRQIGDVFGAMGRLFIVDATALGFAQGDRFTFELTPEVNTQTGAALTTTQINTLQDLNTVMLRIVTGNTVSGGAAEIITATVNLGADATLSNSASTDAAALAAFVAQLNTALSAYSLAATVVSGAIRIVASHPGNDNSRPLGSFSIVGATRRDTSTDDVFSLADLGFAESQYATVTDVLDGGAAPATIAAGDETLLKFKAATGHELVFGSNFATEMTGVETLRFVATVDGMQRFIDIDRPASGWVTSGAANVSAIVTAFNTAFTAQGISITAAANGGNTGLVFSANGEAVSLGVDTDYLTRALNITTLIDFVNNQLASVEVFEGSELKLTEDGELYFIFPDVRKEIAIDSGDGVSLLSTEGLGLGQLADLSLEARLTAALNARFSSSVGIDLIGFVTDLIATSGADSAAEAEVDRATVTDAVLDNVFFADLAIEAELTGTASEVTGSAQFGMVEVELGADDATLNWLALNTQVDVTLVGTSDEDGYNNQLTLNNIADAIRTTGGDAEAGGIRGLVGRFEIQGGIVTDGAGNALDAAGAVADFTSYRVEDADTYTPASGEELVEFYASLGDVKLNVAGINGLNEGLIEGVNLSVGDIFEPLETFDYALVSENQAALDAINGLSALEEGDILDSMAAIANLLVVAGDTLKTRLPFLDMDVPLLNFSLMDSLNFAKDFIDGLREVRDNPQSSLDKIDTMLEEVFGADTVTLTWDAAERTVIFELTFKFLEDYSEELPFALDLKSMVGDSLADILGETVADVITGLVDVSGDGAMIFDPDLSMHFVFGIDLKPTLGIPSVVAAETSLLSELDTVSDIIGATNGGDDLKISWTDATTGTSKEVSVDLAEAKTLGEAVDAINTAVSGEFGANVSFSYDAVTGLVSLIDSNAHLIDNAGVNALFGAVESSSAPVSGDETINLTAGFAGFAAATSFTLVLGKDAGHDGEAVVVRLAADAARDTAEEYAAALNEALENLAISRRAISDTAGPVLQIAVSQLVQVVNTSGQISLVATNFATTVGYDDRGFSVLGVDVSHEISFSVDELDGSNAARMLGFEEPGTTVAGDLVSVKLWEAADIGAPRVYLDTEASGIQLDISAGVADGLNVTLGIGPIEVNVVDGHALLVAADGSGDPAFIRLGVLDVDGDSMAGQYNLSDIYDLANDENRSFLELFELEVSIGASVDLPLSDNVGVFNPDLHGVTYEAALLETIDGASLADFDLDNLASNFTGDIINLYETGSIDLDNLEIRLPGLEDLLGNFNYIAFLNDPRAVLDGLDMILDRMQSLFDDYLSDISLPVVGDAIGAGVTFFQDFRVNVLEKIRVLAETPEPDGSYPTTEDLLTNAVNDLLNDLLGTSGEVYLQAELITEGRPEDAYLVGSLNFNGIIFDEMLDIAFDFGIPGLDMDVSEGSAIRMVLDYSVNLGFGIDRRGFYLMNDTDDPEVKIQITADAGSFEGSVNVLGVLGLEAKAVTLGSNGNIDASQDGTAVVAAWIGADLYGETGLEIVDHAPATDEEVERDLSALDLRDGIGNELTFERVVYLTSLDMGDLIAFTFGADVDIQLGLEGSILDPTTGNPVEVGGVTVIPTVRTEVIVKGSYVYGDGLDLERLSFDNVRVDASELYESILKPVLDPIMDVLNPIAEYFRWTQEEPFNFAFDALGQAFPVIGIANTAVQIGLDVVDFANALAANGGQIIFGDFDFSAEAEAYVNGEAKMSDASSSSIQRNTSGSSILTGSGTNPIGVFGNIQQGISIEIPLITDPMNALNLLLGNFEKVDLVEAHFNLFNIDSGRIDVVQQILGMIDAPGWVEDAIDGALDAWFSLKFKAGFTAGYDLGGIVNFVNTLDPLRLLDGVYIDSAPGSLITAEVGGGISLNAGIAGASASVGAGVHISLNDPNADGKLRIPELIALVEAAADDLADGDIVGALGTMFVGDANYYARLSIWAGINLPWPLPDLTFDFDVFDVSGSINFGGNPIAPRIVTGLDNGETAFLNIGARSGDSMSRITGDGNDRVTVSGSAAGSYSVAFAQGSQSMPNATFSQDPSAIVVPAGEGNNLINLSGITDNTPTVVFTGSGTDTITLPAQGIHVVFAGEGRDTIKLADGATGTGTYIIFGEKGSDTVNIPGGNVIYFGDSDFGMRDKFLATYADGGITETTIRSFFGIGANGLPSASGATNYELNGSNVNLATLIGDATSGTQLSCGKDADTVTLGAGNHAVMTGGGRDVITVNGTAGTGTMSFILGAGDDKLEVKGGAASVFVEAGAGADRVVVEANTSEIWGWGQDAGEDGVLGTEAGRELDNLAMRDGADVLVGGSGADEIHGQLGADVIQGGLGADTITGGIGRDLLAGGTLVLTTSAGSPISIANFSAAAPSQTEINMAVVNAADGADNVSGGKGDDIVIGGGGGDTVAGDSGADVVLGDFGTVGLSANLIAQSVKTDFDSSTNAGTDNATGGEGNDIIIVGGGVAGQVEIVVDTLGSNVVVGDFGQASGNRLMEAVTKLESFTSAQGSADNITTGAGADKILGGEGNDVISSGGGADIVIGDIGIIDLDLAVVTGTSNANAGDDSITTDTSDGILDIVIGGQGSDTIIGGAGGLVALGDDGTITLDSVALSLLLAYVEPAADASAEDLAKDALLRARIEKLARETATTLTASDGNDVISVEAGLLLAALGGGSDSAANNGEDGVIYVLGDDGTITVATDVTLVSAASTTGGNDSITGNNGNSIAFGGLGADQITLGNGENLILGDVGSYDGTSLATFGTLGGNDSITSGTGNDVILGGAGNDTIAAGDGENRLLGDAGSYDRTTLVSAPNAGDGNDSVNAGVGNDWAILGQGSDTADLGGGANWVMGDSGTQTAGNATTTDNDQGGADSIATGLGDDVILGGAGADTINAGDGENRILGDTGSYDSTTLTSALNAGDGNDSVTSGSGNDWAILGQGDDTANLGDGANWVLGDSGWLNAGNAASTSNDQGGADTITSGLGGDVVFGGAGADSVIASDGDNRILGDSGTYDGTTFTSELSVGDGSDTVTAGTGNDWVILGQGSELADLGAGHNQVVGDSGTMSQGNVTTTSDLFGGTDNITTATGNDVIMGGANADTIAAGNGENRILGDSGSYDSITLTSALNAGDGNDSVTSGVGNDWAVLGQGADTANFGDGANWVIGDSGYMSEGSASTTQNDQGGADTITTGQHADVVIGGAGADVLTAGDGDNRILGDSGTYDGTTFTSELSVGDGSDTVTAGTGNDWVILGQGSELADLGAGHNQVVGDSGTMSQGNVTTTSNEYGGTDRITTAGGNDMIMGGANADTIAAGDGENRILGDNGVDDSTTITSRLVAGDGNDSVTSGSGMDLLILGQGDDITNAGDGDNRVLGDSGTITRAAATTTTTLDESFGGSDTITAGAGNDVLVGGAAGDTITGGAGDNTVLGDNGHTVHDPARTPGVTLADTSQDGQGDSDVITTLGGRDVILGGDANDTIASGAGADLVMGDFGVINGSASGQTGSMTSDIGEPVGNDRIDAGDGNDIVIAGQGDDHVFTGNGDDVVAGDSATVTFSNDSDVETLLMTDMDRGGNDTLTGEATDGDKVMLGQYGDDSIIGANGDDVLLGDLATISFLRSDWGLNGQSNADRVNGFTAIRPDAAFADTIYGGTGSDFAMGGMGDDILHGQDGQDILLGDTVIMARTWTLLVDGSIFERMTLDTNFAYLDGGYDLVYGEAGADVMVGGLGPDLFFGNTADDLIFSDGYAGIFNAAWASGFTGDTPHRALITSNFAGPGAIDVVSESQQNASIGNPLDLIMLDESNARDRDNIIPLFSTTTDIDALIAQVSSLLGKHHVTQAIAMLLLGGADPDLLLATLQAEIAASLKALGFNNLLAQEAMIQKLIEIYLAKAGVSDQASNPSGAEAEETKLAYRYAAE